MVKTKSQDCFKLSPEYIKEKKVTPQTCFNLVQDFAYDAGLVFIVLSLRLGFLLLLISDSQQRAMFSLLLQTLHTKLLHLSLDLFIRMFQ